MNKKIKSTYDEHYESLSLKERKEYDRELRELALSELILALMKQDEISVRKLAKLAEISPTVVQAMRSGAKRDFSMQSFLKILQGLGCKRLTVELHGKVIPMEFVHRARK